MDYAALYQEFKFKRMAERHAQQAAHIQEMTNQSHTTDMSNPELHRLMENLDHYPDEYMVDVEASVPILKDAGVLLVLDSVQGAKDKLEEGEAGQKRLMDEAQFLFFLWNMIVEEEISCREFKEIIVLLHSTRKSELTYILTEQYSDQERVQSLLNSWANLVATQNYYKCTDSDLSSPISSGDRDRPQRAPLADNTNLFSSHLNYTCQLSAQQEKDLVNRLYRTNIYEEREALKKQKDAQKEQEELSQCTFQPRVAQRSKSVANGKPKEIKGFEKTISRMKAGQERLKENQQMRNYKPIGENYEKLRQKKINPPKFLNRVKKEESKFLFMIEFDLGRHKTNVKIKENDTEDSVAQRLCKIYSLNKDFYEQIRNIVRGELETYYQELYEQSALRAFER